MAINMVDIMWCRITGRVGIKYIHCSIIFKSNIHLVTSIANTHVLSVIILGKFMYDIFRKVNIFFSKLKG